MNLLGLGATSDGLIRHRPASATSSCSRCRRAKLPSPAVCGKVASLMHDSPTSGSTPERVQLAVLSDRPAGTVASRRDNSPVRDSTRDSDRGAGAVASPMANPPASGSSTGRVQLSVLSDRLAREVRYLRLSLTDRCNYRCTYCMPERVEHVRRSELLSFEEIVALVSAFARWGVERVRLTGGEPTLRKDLERLVAGLVQIPTRRGRLGVAMTTNGERLEAVAGALHAAGLREVTVSIDSLSPERFRQITRRGNLGAVVAGIAHARRIGFTAIKLNTVAIRGFNDDELGDIAKFAWNHHAVPRFIEMMPMSEGQLFVPGEMMSAEQIRRAISLATQAPVEADDGEGVRGLGPASYFRVASGPFAGRRFGTIGAMTENFCGSCNRLRVSATGQVHGCLAHDDAADLKAALRSGDELAVPALLHTLLASKRDGHDFALDGSGGPRKAMITIGG
ncbi:MAG: GTP 3',8-cyclase MoaA [Myxococcales bacterium FL481]|nr:MAG: GTP 3',8-cyclase MoaA [Myxococcales bacterium FL481]